jgi:hypothetical protein
VRRACPFNGKVPASIAAPGFARATKEAGSASLGAPGDTGIQAVKATNAPELNNITAAARIGRRKERGFSVCICMEASLPLAQEPVGALARVRRFDRC